MKRTHGQGKRFTRDNVERWRRLVRVMDGALNDYERALAALRRRTVANLKRTLRKVKRSTG